MCSISGVFSPKFAKLADDQKRQVLNMIRGLMIRGQARGRDAIGYSMLIDTIEGSQFVSNKSFHLRDVEISELPLTFKSIIINHRAEPLSEVTEELTSSEDLQPFTSDRYSIVHNGTIANDKELALEYDFKMRSSVDTEIILKMIEKEEGMVGLLPLKGSYAIGVQDLKFPESFMLACNYQAIYICFDNYTKSYYFASSKDFFGDVSDMRRYSVMKVKPYSCVYFHGLERREIDIAIKGPSKERALVVCSGGLDSTVAATMASQKFKEIELIHFGYGCKAERREKESIVKIATALDCKYKFIETDLFTKYARGSSIVEEDGKISSQLEGTELAKEWVYCRNLIFLSMAAGYAEANNYGVLCLGNNLEEAGAFSDNTEVFIDQFNEILPHALNLNNHLRVEMPVGNLMKKEIVQAGLSLKAPLEHTWSCYHGGQVHCGECSPCGLRKMAFHVLGKEDPIKYKSDILMKEI